MCKSVIRKKWFLKLELVGYFGRNLLEANRGARYPFEADTIEGEAWQFTNFNFPLN